MKMLGVYHQQWRRSTTHNGDTHVTTTKPNCQNSVVFQHFRKREKK